MPPNVVLEIESGPAGACWMSPDLWVVPGDDPEGPPGMPIVGFKAFLWARVHNVGADRVEDARVKYYWTDAASGFDQNTANPLGESNVTLEIGQTAEVLCLTPWVPSHNGHQCILAQVFHEVYDPLPAASEFLICADRHVAQRNLSVLTVTKSERFKFDFEVFNVSRLEREFTLTAALGDLRQLATLESHGFALHKQPGNLKQVGFVNHAGSHADANEVQHEMTGLRMPPHSRIDCSLVGSVSGGSCLVHISQTLAGRVVGGVSVVIMMSKEVRDDTR
jgi:hypothetical protein